MHIPKSLYASGCNVAVDGAGTAHKIRVVAVESHRTERWDSGAQVMRTSVQYNYGYGIGCLPAKSNPAEEPPVRCFSAQWAAEVVGIEEVCTVCWPETESA